MVSDLSLSEYDSIVSGRNPIYSSYEAYKKEAGTRAYDLLLKIKQCKINYGDKFHILPGNGELDYLNKRGGESFRNEVRKRGSLEAVEKIITTMPLFLVASVGGKKYLFSHGGLVRSSKFAQTILPNSKSKQDPLMPLRSFPRYSSDESVIINEKSGKKITRNLEGFQKICYTTAKDDINPPECVREVCEQFQVDYHICGHIHLFGPKQEEIQKLAIRIPQSNLSYGKTDNGVMHIVNSMGLNGIHTYLEITSNGIEVKTI